MLDENDFAEEVVDEVAPVDDTSEGGEQAQEPAASEEPQEKAYVTVEQFEALQAQLADREEEILRRAKQSSRDQAKAIQAEVEKTKKLFEATTGIKLSPEQERMMRQQVEADMTADVAQESPNAKGQDAGEPMSPEQIGAMIEQVTESAFKEAGAVVSPSDPEGKAIDEYLRTPGWTEAGLMAVSIKAGLQKAQRLSKSKSKSRVQQPTGGGGKGVRTDAIKYDPKKPASYYLEQAG